MIAYVYGKFVTCIFVCFVCNLLIFVTVSRTDIICKLNNCFNIRLFIINRINNSPLITCIKMKFLICIWIRMTCNQFQLCEWQRFDISFLGTSAWAHQALGCQRWCKLLLQQSEYCYKLCYVFWVYFFLQLLRCLLFFIWLALLI